MIRVNLLPVREIKAEVGRRRDLLIAGISLGLTILLAVGLYQYQSYRKSGLEKELAELRKEIQVLNVKAKNVADLQIKIKEFKSKNKVIEDLNKKKTGPVRVMESLSAATPPALWLTEFKETGGSLSISGMAIDNQTVADFLTALSTYGYFDNVELVETTQVDQQDGRQLKKFAIRSSVSYQLSESTAEDKPKAAAPKKKAKDG
jgi:type IV pilus assembly protein PilN